MQQGTREERIVAKSKPTLNLVSQSAASSSTAQSSSASSRPGILRAPRQGSNLTAKVTGKLTAGGSNQNDAASNSQVWPSDARTNDSAKKLAAARTNQDLSFQDCASKLVADSSESNDEDDNVPHLWKVHANLRQLATRQTGRPRKDKLDWFMTSSQCGESNRKLRFPMGV